MAKDTLASRVYLAVCEDIREDKFSAEDCIVENDICRAYHVSKATAGEVLHRLTQDGLLKSYPRKGYMLQVYSREDFMKIRCLRFAAESLVLQDIAEKASEEEIRSLYEGIETMRNIVFHTKLAHLCGDSFLVSSVENLLTKAQNSYRYVEFPSGSSELIASRHRAIVDALVKRDAEAAREALRKDLELDSGTDLLGDLSLWRKKKPFTADCMRQMKYICEPDLSSDGKSAALTVWHTEEADGKFYAETEVCNSESGEVIKIAEDGFSVKDARFDASGEFLYYLCDKSGEFQLYRRNGAGRGKEEKLSSCRHGIMHYDLSPDGNFAAVEAKLWPGETEDGSAFSEMTPDEKKAWLEEKEWEPQEITQIDYKRDEWKGVSDGSRGMLVRIGMDGSQSLLVSDLPCEKPAVSSDGKKIAFYAQPYTGPFYSSRELFVIGSDGTERKQVTKGRKIYADAPACFEEDSEKIVYTGIYAAEHSEMILYLYEADLLTGKTRCLFDPEKEETCSGVYAMPFVRTQYGSEKPYFAVQGDSVWFLSVWDGKENLYRMSLKNPGSPEAVIDGNFSVHEFCLPKAGKILITRGDFASLRELYLFDLHTGICSPVGDHNSWLKERMLGKTEACEVKSRDEKVMIHGWICRPAGFREGVKYPAVLYIHGGPEGCYTNDFWHEIQILANAGYAVVYCNPRGSSGDGLKFCSEEAAWGQEASEDLMTFLDYAISKGYIDENRIGVTGGSYGGYMTCRLIMESNRFRAAVGQRIFVNKASSYGSGDMGFYTASIPYTDVRIQKCLTDRARTSIIKNVDKISTPLLLLHGFKDYRCGFEQAEQMFIAMKERRREVPVRLVMFPGENHGVSRTGLMHFQIRHVTEMVQWFDRFLKGEKSDEAEQ